MKKLQQSGAEYLNKMLMEEYNLTISQEKAERIVKKLWNKERKKADQTGLSTKGFLDRALNSYFSTTQLPATDISNHSCYYYNKFLKRYFYIIPIKKQSLLGKLYKKLFIKIRTNPQP